MNKIELIVLLKFLIVQLIIDYIQLIIVDNLQLLIVVLIDDRYLITIVQFHSLSFHIDLKLIDDF